MNVAQTWFKGEITNSEPLYFAPKSFRILMIWSFLARDPSPYILIWEHECILRWKTGQPGRAGSLGTSEG